MDHTFGGSMRVLTVSDCPAVRHGLQRVLNTRRAVISVEASTTRSALSTARRIPPELLFLDPGPDMKEGILLCRAMKEIPGLGRVVIYTSSHPPHALAVAAIAAADGCINGRLPRNELNAAIDRTLKGGPAWAPATDEAQTHRVLAAACRVSHLSRRERQVLGLLTQRKTNQEISETLHISPRTVKNHMTSLLRKLGYKNRTELWRDWSL